MQFNGFNNQRGEDGRRHGETLSPKVWPKSALSPQTLSPAPLRPALPSDVIHLSHHSPTAASRAVATPLPSHPPRVSSASQCACAAERVCDSIGRCFVHVTRLYGMVVSGCLRYLAQLFISFDFFFPYLFFCLFLSPSFFPFVLLTLSISVSSLYVRFDTRVQVIRIHYSLFLYTYFGQFAFEYLLRD